jgi:hypothetical protein
MSSSYSARTNKAQVRRPPLNFSERQAVSDALATIASELAGLLRDFPRDPWVWREGRRAAKRIARLGTRLGITVDHGRPHGHSLATLHAERTVLGAISGRVPCPVIDAGCLVSARCTRSSMGGEPSSFTMTY